MTKDRQNKNRRWPDLQEEWLLKASLTSGKSCLDSWNRWKDAADIDSLDQTSRRLIPLLYHNLNREGIDDPLLDTFKGIYRYTWYSNNLLFNAASTLVRTFQRRKIQTMLLKGAALILVYYKDFGLRPMHDLDILVPLQNAREALTLMIEGGWRPRSQLPKKMSETYFRYVHGAVMKNPKGFDCDLHWNILEDSYLKPGEADFFRTARRVNFQDMPVHVPSPTDLLFQLCIHGMRYHEEKNIRWIADAITLIEEDGKHIQWQEMMDKSQKLGLFLPFKEAILYLSRVFSVSVPHFLLQRIVRIPVSENERKEFEIKGRSLKRIGRIRYNWQKNLRSLHNSGANRNRNKWIEFLKFYQHMWGIDSLWKLPQEKIRKMFKSASSSLRRKKNERKKI